MKLEEPMTRKQLTAEVILALKIAGKDIWDIMKEVKEAGELTAEAAKETGGLELCSKVEDVYGLAASVILNCWRQLHELRGQIEMGAIL